MHIDAEINVGFDSKRLPSVPVFGSTYDCVKYTFSVGIGDSCHSRIRSSALGLWAIGVTSLLSQRNLAH